MQELIFTNVRAVSDIPYTFLLSRDGHDEAPYTEK